MKEFKILEYPKDKRSWEGLEKALAEKSAEGWEVVSLTVDVSSDIRGRTVVLLQRDR